MVRVGVPYEEILNEADKLAPDFIVIGHEVSSRLGRFLLGTTAERVVRHARSTVVVTRRPSETASSGLPEGHAELASGVPQVYPPPTPFNYPNP